jgi:dUTP pyrophosphatase
MTTHWYELEIKLLDAADQWYPIALYNRSDENAGYDLYTSQHVEIGQDAGFVPFGIAARLLKVANNGDEVTDSHFLLAPRSSIYKSGLIMANSLGVIDKGYRGELKAPVWSLSGKSNVACGERLFQILAPDMGWIRNVRVVDTLPSTMRGANGFGSSGR